MLSGLPRGSAVFIDSNIFTYHLSGHSKFGKSSKEFLEAVEDGVYRGYINDIVISEVLLNFSKSELYRMKKIEPGMVAKEIKANSKLLDVIDFDKPISLIENLKLEILAIDFKISEITDAIKEHRLLPNDSIHLLAMKKGRVENIATNDSDFRRIREIKVWMP